MFKNRERICDRISLSSSNRATRRSQADATGISQPQRTPANPTPSTSTWPPSSDFTIGFPTSSNRTTASSTLGHSLTSQTSSVPVSNPTSTSSTTMWPACGQVIDDTHSSRPHRSPKVVSAKTSLQTLVEKSKAKGKEAMKNLLSRTPSPPSSPILENRRPIQAANANCAGPEVASTSRVTLDSYLPPIVPSDDGFDLPWTSGPDLSSEIPATPLPAKAVPRRPRVGGLRPSVAQPRTESVSQMRYPTEVDQFMEATISSSDSSSQPVVACQTPRIFKGKQKLGMPSISNIRQTATHGRRSISFSDSEDEGESQPKAIIPRRNGLMVLHQSDRVGKPSDETESAEDLIHEFKSKKGQQQPKSTSTTSKTTPTSNKTLIGGELKSASTTEIADEGTTATVSSVRATRTTKPLPLRSRGRPALDVQGIQPKNSPVVVQEAEDSASASELDRQLSQALAEAPSTLPNNHIALFYDGFEKELAQQREIAMARSGSSELPSRPTPAPLAVPDSTYSSLSNALGGFCYSSTATDAVVTNLDPSAQETSASFPENVATFSEQDAVFPVHSPFIGAADLQPFSLSLSTLKPLDENVDCLTFLGPESQLEPSFSSSSTPPQESSNDISLRDFSLPLNSENFSIIPTVPSFNGPPFPSQYTIQSSFLQASNVPSLTKPHPETKDSSMPEPSSSKSSDAFNAMSVLSEMCDAPPKPHSVTDRKDGDGFNTDCPMLEVEQTDATVERTPKESAADLGDPMDVQRGGSLLEEIMKSLKCGAKAFPKCSEHCGSTDWPNVTDEEMQDALDELLYVDPMVSLDRKFAGMSIQDDDEDMWWDDLQSSTWPTEIPVFAVLNSKRSFPSIYTTPSALRPDVFMSPPSPHTSCHSSPTLAPSAGSPSTPSHSVTSSPIPSPTSTLVSPIHSGFEFSLPEAQPVLKDPVTTEADDIPTPAMDDTLVDISTSEVDENKLDSPTTVTPLPCPPTSPSPPPSPERSPPPSKPVHSANASKDVDYSELLQDRRRLLLPYDLMRRQQRSRAMRPQRTRKGHPDLFSDIEAWLVDLEAGYRAPVDLKAIEKVIQLVTVLSSPCDSLSPQVPPPSDFERSGDQFKELPFYYAMPGAWRWDLPDWEYEMNLC